MGHRLGTPGAVGIVLLIDAAKRKKVPTTLCPRGEKKIFWMSKLRELNRGQLHDKLARFPLRHWLSGFVNVDGLTNYRVDRLLKSLE